MLTFKISKFSEILCKLQNKTLFILLNQFGSDPIRNTLGYIKDYSFIGEKFKMEVTLLLMKKLQKAMLNENTYMILKLESELLRSHLNELPPYYINFEKQEICIRYAIDDLILLMQPQIVSPIIFNVIKTPQSTLKFLLCEDEYLLYTSTGTCTTCDNEFSKKFIEQFGQILGNVQYKALQINFYLINLL